MDLGADAGYMLRGRVPVLAMQCGYRKSPFRVLQHGDRCFFPMSSSSLAKYWTRVHHYMNLSFSFWESLLKRTVRKDVYRKQSGRK